MAQLLRQLAMLQSLRWANVDRVNARRASSSGFDGGKIVGLGELRPCQSISRKHADWSVD